MEAIGESGGRHREKSRRESWVEIIGEIHRGKSQVVMGGSHRGKSWGIMGGSLGQKWKQWVEVMGGASRRQLPGWNRRTLYKSYTT